MGMRCDRENGRLKIVEFSDDSGDDRKSNGDERSGKVVNVIVLFQASLLNSAFRGEPLIKYFYNGASHDTLCLHSRRQILPPCLPLKSIKIARSSPY